MKNITKPSTLLVFDAENRKGLPARFRTCQDSYKPLGILELYKKGADLPSRLGLNTLNASASAQFSEKGFEAILESVPHKGKVLYVVDLREEFHGFSEGNAISWYGLQNADNVNSPPPLIAQQEAILLKTLSKLKNTTIYKILVKTNGKIEEKNSFSIKPKRVQSEQALVEGKSIIYKRFYVTDHYPPNDAQVDKFIDFVQQLPPNAWLHIHCRGGGGRSSTFLAMYDMIHHAKKMSFNEIMNRHALLGSTPLLKVSKHNLKTWQEEGRKKRRDFIKKFYRYARDIKGFGAISWSLWNQQDQYSTAGPLSRLYWVE